MKKARFWLGIVVAGVLLASCGGSSSGSEETYVDAKPGTSLNFSGTPLAVDLENFSSEESFLIERALSMLGGMPKGTGNRTILDVREFSGEGINEWLSKRMKTILGVGTRFQSIVVDPAGVTGLGKQLDSTAFRNVLKQAYMANLSALFVNVQDEKEIKTGKKYVHKLNLKSQTVTMDKITSGIFLAGDALTKDHMKHVAKAVGYKKDNYFSLSLMISVLIHESRHGEGKGIYKTLKHRSCPHVKAKDEDGDDIAVCDDTANGPNGSAVAFLKYAKSLCTDCNDQESGAFDAAILEFTTRVIPGSPVRDITPVNEVAAQAL